MFRIKSYGQLSGWYPIAMTMPLSIQTVCPCDGGTLETVCKLVGDDATVRVGACPKCGYVGYIDRPSQEWFGQFYASQWDAGSQKDLGAVVELMRGHESGHPAAALVAESGVGRDERILEVGCGYGCALKELRAMGFNRVSGVEPCAHRAGLVRDEFAIHVSGDLSELDGNYGMICSFHSLEHCYDPTETIRQSARLQKRGGLLGICVPRQSCEPTMGVLLFLPHLHSFTELSLVNLMASFGYSILKLSADDQSMYALGIKANTSAMDLRTVGSGVETASRKLRAGLHWDEPPSSRFWWQSSKDESGFVPEQQSWEEFSAGIKRPRMVNVEACEQRNGLEVRFDGPLQLCVK